MKKIMFNDKYGLTQAVLEGRKTQTRRLILPQSDYDEHKGMVWKGYNRLPYNIGEEVAIAQSYFDCGYTVSARRVEITPGHLAQFSDGSAGWNNKMFVCADLMPHRIKITNIRVERLHDIGDEDCLKEGIRTDGYKQQYYCASGFKHHYSTPREAFAALINKTCGKGTWDRNPWVFVYAFELIK